MAQRRKNSPHKSTSRAVKDPAPDPQTRATVPDQPAGETERKDPMTNKTAESAPFWENAMLFYDVMTTPVVIADNEFVIRYANDAAMTAFKGAEATIREHLPDFRANSMVGTCIDDFHANPAHQRRMLGRMTEPMNSKIEMGDMLLTFTVVAMPSASGNTEAYMVELQDRSRQKKIEQEQKIATEQFHKFLASVTHMAEEHEAGDIDIFVKLDDFSIPAIRDAADKVNEMVLDHINTKKAAMAAVEQFGEGNFDAQFPQQKGKRVFLNEIIEKVRGNFRNVVEEVRRLSDSIVSGNLDVQPNLSTFTGEYRVLVESFDRAFGSLNNAFSLLAEQIDQVATTVGQVSHSSQALSTNSQVASSSVEEVSASVSQTDQQVRANAEASQQAAQFVNSAVETANQGANKIQDMVSAMHGIKTSSQDIAKIIKVIDEIAFQTNLLALNAAVEAARAGQHGRGFAVVAQEVRNLAGRSAKAARETSELIDDASKRVNDGVRIADETSEAFTGISTQITQVKEIVEDIDRAGAEQSRGVAQISKAMSEISKSALDTSQQADELAAGAAEMSAATEQMKEEIQRFTLRKLSTSMVKDGMTGFTPEMMAQLQSMLNGKMNGNSKLNGSGSIDVDERGYQGF